MRKRHLFFAGVVLLAILLTLVVFQVSLTFGEYGPTNAAQTFLFWAVSTLIFLLTVTLSFMLFRETVKLYLERQRNREGSRIRSKLVFGALALSLLPVVFLFLFSYAVLNRNLDKWFSAPVEGMNIQLRDAAVGLGEEVQSRADALAHWLAALPEVRNGTADFAALCRENRIEELRIDSAGGSRVLCPTIASTHLFSSRAELGSEGTLVVRVRPHVDVIEKQNQIQAYVNKYNQLATDRRSMRNLYLLFQVLIALFILFVATWIALMLAKQISLPISALLEAASQVRKGNLGHRVNVPANDEMASLVRGFNEMMHGLEGNSRELESRRRFTEAILESIPTGVISLTSDGRIQRVNRALRGLFPADQLERAANLGDLFPPEHAAELRYLMKRARRTGLAASQVDLERPGQVLHLALTVSALPAHEPAAPGYVVVLEDTSEMLRAQKAEAWHEVARRIAHELKNPLTPIALSAERIARQLDRGASTADSHRVLRECAATISREVESVKTLADEFSQFSRFPKAQMVPCDLNAVVRIGLDVFDGRLDGIDVHADLAPDLPRVNLDPDQFKRVVVNLVDNAAEAMRDAMVKRLIVATRATSADSVELVISDTGAGISAGDKEKLFLPYFSTKGRGTGLGLAIVSHILSEHGGRIRVEDNRPAGTRFFIEVPVATFEVISAEAEIRA
ncbi:MAG: multi-sensor signal transduction histidine kinase [Bryobacterales bacterium]|nr:multi-sensor signal transduction histidine kinase [Bryobacterales bacterium]